VAVTGRQLLSTSKCKGKDKHQECKLRLVLNSCLFFSVVKISRICRFEIPVFVLANAEINIFDT